MKAEPIIRAYVDKKSIFIGDRIRYTIKIEAKKKFEVEFPKFKDNKIGEFEIKDAGKSWFDVAIYTVGKHRIPPLEIKYREKGKSDWDIKKTDEVYITVQSVLPKQVKALDIKDIKGPVHFYEINWFLAIGVFLAAAICISSFIAYKRRRSRLPLRLPHETALEELEAIKGIFARTGDVKEYYVGISDCVRRYIERAFKLKAPEMTTEEFLISLKDSTALSYEDKGLLKEFLSACDLVKFAKYAPTRPEMESVFTTAKKFIEPKQ